MSEQKSFLDKSGVAKLWQQIKDYVTSKTSSATIDYNLLFPIGKTIMISNIDADYSNYLGFTWERDYVGKFPVGYDPEDSDFSSQGQTGGEKTHTLTINEIPSHNHTITDPGHSHAIACESGGTTVGPVTIDRGNNRYSTYSAKTGISIKNTGGGQPYNNMPPYKVAVFWTRVA